LVCGFGQGNITVFGPFPSMDMDHFSVSVDIGHFQVKAFLEPQPAGIDCCQVGVIVKCPDVGKDASDFILCEYCRKALFCLGPDDIEEMPVALEYMKEEEFNAGVTDAHGGRGPSGNGFAMDKIAVQLIFAYEVRHLVVKLHKLTHGAGIGLLGAFSLAINLKPLYHLLMPLGFVPPVLFHNALLSRNKVFWVKYYYGRRETEDKRLWVIGIEWLLKEAKQSVDLLFHIEGWNSTSAA